MKKKKALLLVVGGRIQPDVSVLFYVQPELVVYLTSEEGWQAENTFLNLVHALPICKDIVPVRDVSAYDFEKGKLICEEICEKYSQAEWEWIFAITSGPKVTCIAAYDVAKQRDIPCLYIDTGHQKVVSLVKDLMIDKKDLFHLNVPHYMERQGRTYREQEGTNARYRSIVEQWGHIAKELALSPDGVVFTRSLHQRGGQDTDPVALTTELLASPLLQKLEKTYQMIEIKCDRENKPICTFTSAEAAHFLSTGDWLEIYVWNEAMRTQFADDCQWGYKIIDEQPEKELDLVLTYNTQLIIGECKTDNDPFKGKRKYLEALDSAANLLGASYVTRVFVTNQPKTKGGAYSSFRKQAETRKIVVVTAEDLPQIGDILKREAERPTFARI